jgi:hypothetical protein
MGEKNVVRETIDGSLAGLAARAKNNHSPFSANNIYSCSFFADNFKYVQDMPLGINKWQMDKPPVFKNVCGEDKA